MLKQPTEKEIETLKNLIRVRQDYDAFCRYQKKLKLKYGFEPIANLLVGDPNLFWELHQILHRWMWEDFDRVVQPKAEELVFGKFVEWGFKPGRDFSIGTHNGERAYWFSDRLREYLEAEGFLGLEEYASSVAVPNPIEQLDRHFLEMANALDEATQKDKDDEL